MLFGGHSQFPEPIWVFFPAGPLIPSQFTPVELTVGCPIPKDLYHQVTLAKNNNPFLNHNFTLYLSLSFSLTHTYMPSFSGVAPINLFILKHLHWPGLDREQKKKKTGTSTWLVGIQCLASTTASQFVHWHWTKARSAVVHKSQVPNMR